MARKKPAKQEAMPIAWKLPESIENSPVLRQTRISQKSLAKFQEKVLLTYTPALMKAFFAALLRQIEEGNYSAMELYARIAHLIEQKGGVSIVTQILNPTVQASNQSPGFDGFMRQLAEKRQQGLPEPVDIRPEDVEVVS